MAHKRRLPRGTAAVLVVVLASGCVSPGVSERAAATWAERLTGQAVHVRLEAQQRERARDAWAQRLTAASRAHQLEQLGIQRARSAWSARLTQLARHFGT